MKYSVISADCHIDLCWLPTDLFVSESSAALRDRMPHVETGPKGPFWTTKAGANMGLVNGMGSMGREYIPGEIHRSDRMASTGLYDDGRKGIRRCSDPDLRLKDQDRDGVQAEVLYGILGVGNRMKDPEASAEVYRIYNDWLADFQRKHPQRYAGLACVPNSDIATAVDETHRAAKLGLRGVVMALNATTTPMWDPAWEPLWAAAEECGLPLSFHTVGSLSGIADVAPKHYRTAFAVYIVGFQLAVADFLTSMIFSGALERHPGLQVVLAESGIGWIPYHLERLDYEWEDQFKDLPFKLKPSEYWHRQIYATYQQDMTGIRLLDALGEDHIMWGSDFPHPDGVWPDSQDYIREQLGHLPEATRRKLICDNAAKLYGFAS
jgi:uncharacterized protein